MFDEERPYYELPPETNPHRLRYYWDIGVGLQKIDNVVPDETEQELIEQQINGLISFDDVERAIMERYYPITTLDQLDRRNALITAKRMTELTSKQGFILTPGFLKSIHGYLFRGLMLHKDEIGQWRKRDIGKPEPVLGTTLQDTVKYAPAIAIEDTLDDLFKKEFVRPDYADKREAVTHSLQFMSNVWKVHPFMEGNTRSTTALLIMYLNSQDIIINNEPFKNNSQYFRDALVLYNTPLKNGGDKKPLLLFTEYLLEDNIQLENLRKTYPKHVETNKPILPPTTQSDPKSNNSKSDDHDDRGGGFSL